MTSTSEWQPIETAPKDGSVVKVAIEDYECLAYWVPQAPCNVAGNYPGGWLRAGDANYQLRAPDRWMPT